MPLTNNLGNIIRGSILPIVLTVYVTSLHTFLLNPFSSFLFVFIYAVLNLELVHAFLT